MFTSSWRGLCLLRAHAAKTHRALSMTPSMSAAPPAVNPIIAQFFDKEENWGRNELRPKARPGRSWTVEELRLKSNSDLHKLWYVVWKERNMLYTMRAACVSKGRYLPNPERIDRCNETLRNIEEVVHERNDAFYKLETGDGASPPRRTVTSFMGFTYERNATEHLTTPASGQKEYEVPYLDDDAYVMQKLWKEKEWYKKFEKDDEKRRLRQLSDDDIRHKRIAKRVFDRPEDFRDY